MKNNYDIKKQSELINEIETNNINKVEKLIKEGIDLNKSLDIYGWPPIHLAVSIRKTKIVETLLNSGADPNLPIESGMAEGMVPLDFAKDEIIVRMLIKKGANIGLKDKRGMTPLEWAIFMKNKVIIEILKTYIRSQGNPIEQLV